MAVISTRQARGDMRSLCLLRTIPDIIAGMIRKDMLRLESTRSEVDINVPVNDWRAVAPSAGD